MAATMKVIADPGGGGDFQPDDGGSKYLWNVGKLYQSTRRYNPDDSHLHTHRRENLKSDLSVNCEFLCLVLWSGAGLYVGN
jgi:hypothetical protein